MLKINVLISTINSGIEKVHKVLLPENVGVSYIIIHQITSDQHRLIHDTLHRRDVYVKQIIGKGLSVSRNEAISIADGDICVICDDDIIYLSDTFTLIRNTFALNPDTDIACFRIKTPDGSPDYKLYPDASYSLNKQKLHYISSIEIAFRLTSVRNHRILFDTRFGLGNKYLPAGEEEAFLQDCIAAGLRVNYFPIEIVEHPYKVNSKKDPFHKSRIWIDAGLTARQSIIKALISTAYKMVKLLPAMVKHKKNPLLFLFQSISAIAYIVWKKEK